MGHQIQEVKAKKYGFLLAEIESILIFFCFFHILVLKDRTMDSYFTGVGFFSNYRKV